MRLSTRFEQAPAREPERFLSDDQTAQFQSACNSRCESARPQHVQWTVTLALLDDHLMHCVAEATEQNRAARSPRLTQRAARR